MHIGILLEIIPFHGTLILFHLNCIVIFRYIFMMASSSSIPARSFYKRSRLHTVIPGSSADSDGSDSGNEDQSILTPRADGAASDDDDYLPAGGNIVAADDDVASSSSSDDEPAPRQGTSTGNRRGTSTGNRRGT